MLALTETIMQFETTDMMMMMMMMEFNRLITVATDLGIVFEIESLTILIYWTGYPLRGDMSSSSVARWRSVSVVCLCFAA
jgi:hypothetical protein